MPTDFRREFRDSEELSFAVRHTNVAAVQTSKGKFLARLDCQAIAGWSLQRIDFVTGTSACAGDGPPDRFAFVVPMQIAPGCRLLGKTVTPNGIGVYAPGSEHADTSSSGYGKIVVVPPKDLLSHEGRDWDFSKLPLQGSRYCDVPMAALVELRSLLDETELLTKHHADSGLHEEVSRSVADALARTLINTLGDPAEAATSGRPLLPRTMIARRVAELLDQARDRPAYVSELAAALGVSHPTLRRVFIECFGMPPARYLLLKRFYLARNRLRSGQCRLVSDAAHACGFWELSRFSKQYKAVFGELPSDTLRKGRER